MFNSLKLISVDEFLQRTSSQPKGNIWSAIITSRLSAEPQGRTGSSV